AASKIRVSNPATGGLLAEFSAASAAEVQAAILRARGAQPAWNEIGPKSRARVLRKFLEILNKHRSEVAALITSEAGKPEVEALLTELVPRSEEHTSELQSRSDLVCRLLLEKKKKK